MKNHMTTINAYKSALRYKKRKAKTSKGNQNVKGAEKLLLTKS